MARERTAKLGQAIPGISEVPLIGIARGLDPARVVDAVRAAVAGGVRVVEITLDSPDVLSQIEAVAGAHPGLTLGVGSVNRPEEIDPALEAGASFVVCPTTSEPILSRCWDLGVPCVPGAASPTEIQQGIEHGAVAVKVFPAEALGGPGYIAAVSAPLRNPPLIPTGGVSPATAPEYIRAGAMAVGAGSNLFRPGASLEEMERRAREWVAAVT